MEEFPWDNIISGVGVVAALLTYYFNIRKAKSDRHLEYDTKLLQKIENIFHQDSFSFLSYMRECDFMKYRGEIYRVMDEFEEFCSTHENIFFDKKLRKRQEKLRKSITKFNQYLLDHSTYTEHPKIYVIYSSHGRHSDIINGFPKDERREIRKNINDMADEIVEDYTKLFEQSKKVL